MVLEARRPASRTIGTSPASAPRAAAAPVAAVAPAHEGWVRSRPRKLLDDVLCVDIATCPVHLTTQRAALEIIAESARRPHPTPLAVSSINLDHVHHFGGDRRHLGDSGMHWLNLVDGAPIARQASRFVGADVPRLAGSDLIGPILDDAAERGLRVAVLGGSPEVTLALRRRMRDDWPGLRFEGHWTPARSELDDPVRSRAIALELREAKVDVVVVCLGKPRQEEWIDAYGSLTGAGVLLAFGAVVDFLAGRVSRAPAWVAAAGIEWMWRLALEPRRLARRYLVEGPPAYLAVRRSPMPTRA